MKGHRLTDKETCCPQPPTTNHTTTTPSRSLLDLVSYREVSRSLHIVSIPHCTDNGHSSGQIL